MSKTEIMDLTVACHSFPELPQPLICRSNILDTIDTILDSDTQIVFVEGQEGIGKTSLLAQFSERHRHRAFSLFIHPASRVGCDAGILRFDLCNQLQWALKQRELKDPEAADNSLLSRLLLGLARTARRTGKAHYFVVDGLEGLPEEQWQVREVVLGMLPFGWAKLRFLFSAESSRLCERLERTSVCKSFPLPGFTLDESARYLGDLPLTQQAVDEIHRTCKGIPGHLASVRRLITSGVDPSSLLEDMPAKLPALFELEWESVVRDDQAQVRLLAILAHDRRKHSVSHLAAVLGIDPGTAMTCLKGLGFLQVDARGEVSFVSEAFRRFAASRLRDRKADVSDLLIDHLLKEPHSDEALESLPGYLEESGRFEDLLGYLSPESFTKIIERGQSLAPMQDKAAIGLRAARHLRRDADLLRFSMQGSAIRELDGAQVWRSEIEALMALDDYDSAIALAQATMLKEDRLHLLAIIARAQRERGLSPEPGLLENIAQLYSQVEPAALGDKAVEIAADLIYSDPDRAIELVERSTGAEPGENRLDWALAKLSLATLRSTAEAPRPPYILESIRSRIRDPKARYVSATASMLLGKTSAAEVIGEAERIAGTSNRLLLLRQWCVANRRREDAAQVMDYALKLALRATEYSANARVFRELAEPLPFVADEKVAGQFVGRFDSQQANLDRLGPTEDYVRLQVLLARTECARGTEACRNRVEELYFYIDGLRDLATKVSCMARLVAALGEMDPEKTLEGRDQLHTLARDDLLTDIRCLLDSTADHYHAARNAVRALSRSEPAMALQLATSLNLEYRRDQALRDLVDSAARAPLSELDMDFVERAIDAIADPDVRDDAVLRLVERFVTGDRHVEAPAEMVARVAGRVMGIRDANERCRACCLVYQVCRRRGSAADEGLVASLMTELRRSWEAIDVGWDRVDAGFKIAAALAEVSVEAAREYLDLANRHREEIPLDSHTSASTYVFSLRLSIRAFRGLLLKRLDGPDDLGRLGQLISWVPSNGVRARLWSDLAIAFHASARPEDCRLLVSQHVKPILQSLRDDAASQSHVLMDVAPALYVAHRDTALEQLSVLPGFEKEIAYARICDFMLERQFPSDPYEHWRGQAYDLSYEDIVDICGVLDQMQYDGFICRVVETISESMCLRRARERLTMEQRAEIVRRLQKVIDEKLPDGRNIRHDGYKIIARGQVARITQASSQEWIGLASDARRIPNLADRAFVLCILATVMPSRETDRRKELLKEADEITAQIPTIRDRIDRLTTLASAAAEIDQSLSKQYLRSAMDMTLASTNHDLRELQRDIIDQAYRLDPDLAASLASFADDDPAKSKAREAAKRQLRVLDLKKKIIQERSVGQAETEDVSSDYARAMWMLLGSLNAGRTEPVHIENTRHVPELAAGMSISKSYPMLAWLVENAVRRYAKTDQASTLLRPMFEATLLGTQLAGRMASRSALSLKQTMAHATAPAVGRSTLVVRPGDREGALEFLRDWFDNAVREYVKICDPYFGPDELGILHMLRAAQPHCKVYILTSKRHHDQLGINKPWEDAYRGHWRLRVSEQDPPDTDIVILGTKSGACPLHDRWCLTQGGGLRLGTSLNALGTTRTSEVSVLSAEEAGALENEVDRYLQRLEREHSGERILYLAFSL